MKFWQQTWPTAVIMFCCAATAENLFEIDKDRWVLIALDAETRQRGLSTRVDLGADGMLFALPAVHRPLFWMKDTRFALTLYGLDRNQCQISQAQLTPHDTTLIPIPATAKWALETRPDWKIEPGFCFTRPLPQAID